MLTPAPAGAASAASAGAKERIADNAVPVAAAVVLAGMAWLVLRRTRRAPAAPAFTADPGVVGVAGKKRLIKALMLLRTVTGGAALLAAVAIVVFWSIEALDPRSGETGLNLPLVALLGGAWAASWCSGRLANMLHRVFFGRVHPKFDT